MFVAAPIAIAPVNRCHGAALLWQQRGCLGVTVVVKATYAILADATLELIEPEEIVVRDRHVDRSPERSLERASELAPYLPGAAVVALGHAHVLGPPSTATTVRLALGREARTFLDKTLRVVGDRRPEAPDQPAPFKTMPLTYERALGGRALPDNPVGCDGAARLPNIVHPTDPRAVAGFGPLGWSWPARKRRLAGFEARALTARIPDLADAFPWGFFHGAPDDQQCGHELRAGDWLELEGLDPTVAVLRLTLPELRAHARAILLMPSGASRPETLAMACDTLIVDADARRLSVLWRGNASLTLDEGDLPRLGFFVGLAKSDDEPPWPSAGELGGLAAQFATAKATVGGSQRQPPIFAAMPALPASAAAPAARVHAPSATPLASPTGVAPTPTGGDTPPAAPRLPSTPWEPPSPPPPDAPPPEPEPPVRTSDDIPVVTTAHFESATLSWQIRPPQDALIVVAKGTYDIVPGEPLDGGAAVTLAARERSDFCTGESYFEDDPSGGPILPSDVALFKPRADVTLFGYAHAPTRHATQMKVRFQFGKERDRRFDKSIHVLGDRAWKRSLVGATASSPASITAVPLAYARAFGGPDHPPNPVGRGRAGDALPNLELVDQHVTSPRDALAPACFAPRSDTWSDRWAKLGTYDKRWLDKRWPYFPEDFDWEHFQAAPRDQQLSHLVGDEPFAVEGVHPEHGALRGRLPGERPRCFLVKRPDAGGGLVEVDLRLDTVGFDFAAMTVNLVWRGFADVSDSDAPEVLALFIVREAKGETPLSRDEIQAAYLQVITPEAPLVATPDPAPLPPPPEPTPTPEDEEAAAFEAELEASLQQELADAGLDGVHLDELAKPDPAALAASLRESGATAGEIEQLLEALAPPPPSEDVVEPPALRLRDLVERMLADGDSFAGFDFEGEDLSDLDFAGRDLTRAVLRGGHYQRCNFDAAILVEAQAGEADFEGAHFVGADLTGIDMTRANLRGVSFENATLVEAELRNVQGERASFAHARADNAELDDSDWSHAVFDGMSAPNIDLNRCVLHRARFTKADIPNVGLRQSQGKQVVFDLAVMNAAYFEEATFSRCSFKNVDARTAVFDNAVLDEADLRGADLTDTSFLRSKCRKTDFTCATLVEANLTRAELGGCKLARANLMNAVLEAADLTIADLRDANLFGTGFWKAKLDGAKLDGVFIARSSLEKRGPR